MNIQYRPVGVLQTTHPMFNGNEVPQIDISIFHEQAQSQSNVRFTRTRSERCSREGGTTGSTAKSDDKSTHASSKSAPGATKPKTGLDAGIAAATDSTRNDASRSQMVQGGEGGAVAAYVPKRDEFDDVEQGTSGSPSPLTLPSSMNHEPGMAVSGSWRIFPRIQPVDHQDGIMAAPTAEGVPQNGDASSKSAPGATKPMTGLDAGIAVATDSTRNDASRSQMVQGGEGGAVATYVPKRDEFDDVEQLHEEASNTAQLDVEPNRRHVVGERMNRGWQSTSTFSVDDPFAIPDYAARKMDASVLNPNAAPFIPSAKKSGPSVGPARNNYNPLAQAQQIQRAQTPPVVSQAEAAIQLAAMSGNGFNHHQQFNAIPPSMQHTQHQKEFWQQQGAVPRYPHQLTVHQQQYMEQQVARPKNSFERQRETAGNASRGMAGGRPTAPPATFKRSSYHNAPTPPQPAWSTVGHIQGLNLHKELVDGEEDDEEDPCVICHDEMSGDNTLKIECGHIFHRHCLQKWLGRQQTCPTCRNFTILKDDYPSLHK